MAGIYNLGCFWVACVDAAIFTNIHGLVRYNGRLGSTNFLNEQICFKIGQNRDCNFQILTGSQVIGIADAARLLAQGWQRREHGDPPPAQRAGGGVTAAVHALPAEQPTRVQGYGWPLSA